MKINNLITVIICAVSAFVISGCAQDKGPRYDRPFPVGQVTDSFWEAQQTNAESCKFIMFDHDFEGETATLTPAGQKHLISIARRLPYVPFPIVIEESLNKRAEEVDVLAEQRRKNVIDLLNRFYANGFPSDVPLEQRVVIAKAFPRAIFATEGEAAFYSAGENSSSSSSRGSASGYGRR